MSTHNALSACSLAAVLVLSTAGCSPTLQDGRFTCATSADCPQGFACRASDMLCYRGTGPDGGAPVDAPISPEAGIDSSVDSGADGGADGGVDSGVDSGVDAGLRDAASDAPTGCGTNCIQLMVLNANPGSSGTIEYQDRDGMLQRLPIPPYGTTSATTDVANVPVGGVLNVNVPPTATIFHELPIPTEGRYLLVLGPAALGASVVLYPSPAEGLHTGDYVYIQLIDMTVDETVGLIATGAGRDSAAAALRNPFEHGMISAELPFLPGGTRALQLALDTPDQPLIAALLADRVPSTEGTYFIVVAGQVSAHLDTEDGLRFIPGLPRATALRSSRLVRFLNTLGTNATACDGATRLATLMPGQLSTPRVPPTSGAWAVTVRTGVDCSTGLSHDVAVGTAVGRTLVSITGDITSLPDWQAVSISEPMPSGFNTTIVLHNGLPTASVIAGSSLIPSLGTASVTETSPPSMITATTMDGLRTFAWRPMTRQAWAVVAFDGAYTAYEVDSPFGVPWTVTEVPGT